MKYALLLFERSSSPADVAWVLKIVARSAFFLVTVYEAVAEWDPKDGLASWGVSWVLLLLDYYYYYCWSCTKGLYNFIMLTLLSEPYGKPLEGGSFEFEGITIGSERTLVVEL